MALYRQPAGFRKDRKDCWEAVSEHEELSLESKHQDLSSLIKGKLHNREGVVTEAKAGWSRFICAQEAERGSRK